MPSRMLANPVVSLHVAAIATGLAALAVGVMVAHHRRDPTVSRVTRLASFSIMPAMIGSSFALWSAFHDVRPDPGPPCDGVLYVWMFIVNIGVTVKMFDLIQTMQRRALLYDSVALFGVAWALGVVIALERAASI